MLVIMKSAPDTPEGKRGAALARDLTADVCLIQNAVYFAQEGRLGDFPGTVYALDEDCRMRGVQEEQQNNKIKKLDYDALVDIMIAENNIIGVL